MIRMWSLIVGLTGLFTTGAAVPFVARRSSEPKPQLYWFFGLAGLFPAWLMAFLGLLQPVAQQAADVPLPPLALFSSAAGLLGIIATDYWLRRSQNAGYTFAPVRYWTLGWLALLPAWFIAMIGYWYEI